VPGFGYSPEALLSKMVKLISLASLFLPLVAMVASAQDHEGEIRVILSYSAVIASMKIQPSYLLIVVPCDDGSRDMLLTFD
jgi:hypothetical protein